MPPGAVMPRCSRYAKKSNLRKLASASSVLLIFEACLGRKVCRSILHGSLSSLDGWHPACACKLDS